MSNNAKTGAIIVKDKNTLKSMLDDPALRESLSAALPQHLTINRIIKMLLIASSRQPRLFNCTKASIAQCAMKSAETGLDCSGTLGRAYLVPYWNSKINAYEAQFIPGYLGLIDLARNTGEIKEVYAEIVYKDDEFKYTLGDEKKIFHIRNLQVEPEDNKIIAAYMVVHFNNGGKHSDVMTIKQIQGIMGRSKSRDQKGKLIGPWVTDFSEMCRKTVVRRGAKYLPMSTELKLAFIADDEQYEQGVSQISTNHMIDNGKSRAEQLVDELKEKPEPEKPSAKKQKDIKEKDNEYRQKAHAMLEEMYGGDEEEIKKAYAKYTGKDENLDKVTISFELRAIVMKIERDYTEWLKGDEKDHDKAGLPFDK